MNFQNLSNLVKTTRCTRRFKPNIKISKKDLEEIIDITRITSSAKNMQPLKYIIVNDKKLVNTLSSTAKWAAHLTSWEQSESQRPSAFIIIVNDTKIDGISMVDAGISLQTIMLASRAKGYASCTLASIDKEICIKEFKLDESLQPMLGIAIGIEDEIINLVDTKDNDTNYYRNNKDEHCVPKRKLDEVLIGSY
jgi:nitroreductase